MWQIDVLPQDGSKSGPGTHFDIPWVLNIDRNKMKQIIDDINTFDTVISLGGLNNFSA
jgi:hypothetical protein